jgi:hypothetical protein
MEVTILSLNESHKIQKHYLAGTYGQGGSSTLAFCKYAFITSRHHSSDRIAFSVVRYEDLPAEEYKTGRYVYLVKDDVPLVVGAKEDDFAHGTIVRHFGFDLTRYTAALGPRSIYGVLQRVLFDPVAPVWFENQVHGWNRTIKGSRNALNGAVDEGDESKGISITTCRCSMSPSAITATSASSIGFSRGQRARVTPASTRSRQITL